MSKRISIIMCVKCYALNIYYMKVITRHHNYHSSKNSKKCLFPYAISLGVLPSDIYTTVYIGTMLVTSFVLAVSSVS